MSTTHKAAQLNYAFEIASGIDLSASAYFNEFSRNWYKASKVGGEKLSGDAAKVASAFDQAGVGTLNIEVKANNRNYESKGIQAQMP